MTKALRTHDPFTLAPARVLRVHGMRRSGNHAVIDWMLRNADAGRGLFLNNCRPGRDPVRTARGVSVYEGGQELAGDPTLGAKLAKAPDSPFTVVSYEDTMPQPQRSPLFDAPETCVIIYRSFLHWSASLLRKIQANTGYGPLERMRVMMQALRTYTEMLGRVQDDDVVPVCYDTWKDDETYRKAALGRIGLPGRDLGLGAVQRYGGGSSFQGKAARAEELATAERAAQMAADAEYQMVLWTAARDLDFMLRLSEVFPRDAERLSKLLQSASLKVTLP